MGLKSYLDRKMRIFGILLIMFGIPFLGWMGYVELFFLNDLESEFEKQRIKSEQNIRSKIKETKFKFDTMKANTKKGKTYKKKITKLDAQLEDLIEGLKANYQNQDKARKELLESSIVTIRNENFTVESGLFGILIIIIGGLIVGATFFVGKDVLVSKELPQTEEENESSIEEDLNTPKLIEAKLLKANLNDANLSESDLSGTNLVGVNLSNVNLSGANLSGTNLTKANLTGVNLRNSYLEDNLMT